MYLRTKSLIVILCLFSTQAFAASVDWINGTTPPIAWTVDPNHPGTADTITFSGPLNFVYSSSCNARGALGGTPQITVDTMNKEVVLSFVGPAPTQCPAIWAPVAGLQGEFGPLPAGNWTFKSASPDIPFNIPFMVGTPSSTYYVDQDAPGPVHNGVNWYWAYRSIQDALNVASPGDTILVAEGRYAPDRGATVTAGDREATFLLQQGISLIGGHAGFGTPSPDTQDPATFVTELSGDLAGNDLFGILNTQDNSYSVVTALAEPNGMPILVDGVVIKAGHAAGIDDHYMGGGLLILGANVTMSRSLFYGNQAAFGGAVAVDGGSLTLVNSQISGNTGLLYGGGLYAFEGSVTLTNCLVTGNTGAQAEFTGGSILYCVNGNTYINNSTLADNVPVGSDGITSLGWEFPPTHELIVNNSILQNGGNEIYTTHPSTTAVSYSNVQGGWAGTGSGNIDADPLFVAPGGWSFEGEWGYGDYRLQNGSPSIDQGSSALLPADVTDLNVNGNVIEPLPLDLDGAARTQGPQTDMGAYETFTTVEPPVEPDWILFDSYNISDTPEVPSTNATVRAGFTITVGITSTQEELGLAIAPISAAGGNWTAVYDPDPGILGPGYYSITIAIEGTNVDLSQLTMGVRTALARVDLYYRVLEP